MAGPHFLYNMLFHKPILENAMNTTMLQNQLSMCPEIPELCIMTGSRDPLYKMDQVDSRGL